MCYPLLAALPALASAGAGAAGVAAGTGTFLGLSATAWGAIGLASTVASTAISAVGRRQQGQQQKAAYKYNAKIQEAQAVDAERRGSMEEGRLRQRNQLIIGAQHAAQGGSGLVAGADSGGDVLAQSAEFGARDAAMARLEGARQAWGFRAGAQGDRYQGALSGSSANARAGNTFLSGVYTAGNKWWENWKRENPFAFQTADVSWSGY